MSQTQAAANPGVAPLVVNVQYVKDLSFEVPGAPAIFTTMRAAPNVTLNLDVNVRRLGEPETQYEVSLVIRAEATEAPAAAANGEAPAATKVFIADLTYAGVFTLTGIPETAVEPILLVECPRLLFPYARNILAEITRDGGFPPVLLQPIDFVALWQARRTQAGTVTV